MLKPSLPYRLPLHLSGCIQFVGWLFNSCAVSDPIYIFFKHVAFDFYDQADRQQLAKLLEHLLDEKHQLKGELDNAKAELDKRDDRLSLEVLHLEEVRSPGSTSRIACDAKNGVEGSHKRCSLQ